MIASNKIFRQSAKLGASILFRQYFKKRPAKLSETRHYNKKTRAWSRTQYAERDWRSFFKGQNAKLDVPKGQTEAPDHIVTDLTIRICFKNPL
jgi:hypothetical protein